MFKLVTYPLFLPLPDVDDSFRGDDDVDGQVVDRHHVQAKVVDNLRLVNRRQDQSSVV